MDLPEFSRAVIPFLQTCDISLSSDADIFRVSEELRWVGLFRTICSKIYQKPSLKSDPKDEAPQAFICKSCPSKRHQRCIKSIGSWVNWYNWSNTVSFLPRIYRLFDKEKAPLLQFLHL